MTNPLTGADRRAMRARAHQLHPVVSISQKGLTEAVLAEIDIALHAHELIKIRVYGAERDQRNALLTAICEHSGAEPVQQIGHILVIFRKRPEEPKTVVKTTKKSTARTRSTSRTPARDRFYPARGRTKSKPRKR
jgi:putative YhbY family RNA-binding protein